MTPFRGCLKPASPVTARPIERYDPMSTDHHVTLRELLIMHVGKTIFPERNVWLIPHMYAEGIQYA